MTAPAPRFAASPRLFHEVRRRDEARPAACATDGNPALRRMRIFAIDPSARAAPGGVVTVSEAFAAFGFVSGSPEVCGPRLTVALPPACAPDQPDATATDLQKRHYADQQRLFQRWQRTREVLDTMQPDSVATIAEAGYAPSLSDPRFIVQMVYATASQVWATFERALGREIVLGIRPDGAAPGGWSRARSFQLAPWGAEEEQAWYERENARIVFGVYTARGDTTGYAPGSEVHTALSHDVIVHEMTHALLDAIKPELLTPTHNDVFAFHEAFADLIAVFQRYSYRELVASEIVKARGDIDKLGLLASLARTFADTTEGGGTLRSLSGELMYGSPEVGEEPHALGNVLVQAVYRAFQKVAAARIGRLIDIATAGSGILPPGALSPALANEIAVKVSKTALMFQSMLIRALDYMPPVGITFFQFLRAVIAADVNLVPIDEDGVRLAWMEAFRHHRIFPRNGLHYDEEQLVWPKPACAAPAAFGLPMLSFAQTGFAGNPGEVLSLDTTVLQLDKVLAHLNRAPAWRALLGLDRPGSAGEPLRAEIIAMRSYARPGPAGMTEFGTVLEIVCRQVTERDTTGLMLATGACLVFDSAGQLRSCALYPEAGAPTGDGSEFDRRELVERYAVSPQGARSWIRDNGRWQLRTNITRHLCAR